MHVSDTPIRAVLTLRHALFLINDQMFFCIVHLRLFGLGNSKASMCGCGCGMQRCADAAMRMCVPGFFRGMFWGMCWLWGLLNFRRFPSCVVAFGGHAELG